MRKNLNYKFGKWVILVEINGWYCWKKMDRDVQQVYKIQDTKTNVIDLKDNFYLSINDAKTQMIIPRI